MGSLILSLDYIAGLFDGEGWISFTRSRNPRFRAGFQYQGIVGLNMRERAIVETIQARYGGRVAPKPVKSASHSQQWEWRAVGAARNAFLNEIGPRLIAKYEQAHLLIDYYGTDGLKTGRKSDEALAAQVDLYERMRGLNQRGIGKALL